MVKQESHRKSGEQLPSSDEILSILNNESSRMAVTYDYLSKHAALFDEYKKLAIAAGTDSTWAEEYPKLTLKDLITKIETSNSLLAEYIRHNPSKKTSYKKLYRSLIPKEDASPSDVIFVFGAQTNGRILRAAELYKDKVAPKIIISGNKPFYKESNEPESVRMAQFATSIGVEESDIILEKESITVPDNVKRTIDLLERMEWHPKSITLVATDFILQRAVMEWYKFTPWKIEIKTVASHAQKAHFSPELWHTDEETIALILNEYAKIVIESKMDLIRQDEETEHA